MLGQLRPNDKGVENTAQKHGMEEAWAVTGVVSQNGTVLRALL